MKLYKSLALASVLVVQSAVVSAAPRGLSHITLGGALPALTVIKLPLFGGLTPLDLPLVGGYLNSLREVGLNQYVATLTHGGTYLLQASQNFLPLLTGTRGDLPGLSTLSKLRNPGSRGNGGIRIEPRNPMD